MSTEQQPSGNEAEQIQLAREIGTALSDAFVAYVRDQVTFEDLTFGVYDALHDLHVVRSGEYELLEEDEEHDHDHHGHDHHQHAHEHRPDDSLVEQEDLAQEPSREGE